VVKGIYNPRMSLPRIPCSDGVGEVLAVGPGVSSVKVGQRVAGLFMPDWIEGGLTDAKGRTALGGSVDGLLSEYAILPERATVPVPDYLTDEEAATLPCAGVTAWNALMESGQVQPGETVLLLGTGGVSLFALQFARMAGARLFCTSSSDAKLERLRTLAPVETVNYKSHPEWGDMVRKMTNNLGVDHVVEVGGAGTLTQSLRAVRSGGHIALIGVLAGYGQFNPLPVLMKGVKIQGIYVGSRHMFEAMNRALALHQVRPVIDRVFPFAEAPQAFAHLESGSHFGKIVIRVE